MVMRFMPTLLPVLLLSACAGGPSAYLMSMQRFQGASEAALVDSLGPPDNVYEVDGVKYLTYSKTTTQSYPSGPVYGGVYGRNGVWVEQSFGTPGANVSVYRCDVFFALRNRVVQKIGHRGNAC